MAENYEPQFGEWEQRAEFLEEHTWLARRQAQIIAMREAGYPRDKIASELDISGNTVDTHGQDARSKYMKSVRTVKLLKDSFSDDDFEEALEQLDRAEREDLESAFEN